MNRLLQLFLWGIISYITILTVTGQTLRPGGVNVCSRSYTYNTYYRVTRPRIDFVKYRTCCKKFIWCTSRCYRSRSRIVYYSVNKLKVKTSVAYSCCPGWARTGQECPNAICRPSCQNGDCVAPNKCKCKPGFAGKYCEQEINECKATPSPCQQVCANLRGSYACSCRRGFRKIGNSAKAKGCQNVNECAVRGRNPLCNCAVDRKDCKATCVDVIGSYRCQCSKGYRLVSNKICTDVDECRTGTHRCQQICLNVHGGYRCACRKGYWLGGDKRSCHDLNECRLANGGCEHVCTNTLGSYRCSCRKGFDLVYDKTRCKDVDECLKYRPCDNVHGRCQNTYGSYRCLCNKGYKLQDGKKCVDVNECQGANECAQNCHNSAGSYFCSCRRGFSLAADRKICNDVDECKAKLHDCDQLCINNFGSYRCQCKAGYILQDDKKTCRALPCKKLYPPHNGFVRCMGLNLGQKCTYTCRSGYKVIGSRDRTCQLSSRWSGAVARCYPKSCEAARPPVNGVLVLPCVEEYKSTCIVHCKKGFKQAGSSLIKCGLVHGKVQWINKDTTCTEIKLCQPNPCKNGGKCVIKAKEDYKCDCSSTGYVGENCQFGKISITTYPPLLLDKESKLLTITARPSKELIIIPEAVSADVVFSPKKLTIRYPRPAVQFKIKPRTSGLIRIKYQLSGRNRLQFSPLKDSVIYVSQLEASEKISQIPDKKFQKTQMNKWIIDRCSNGSPVELLSSCPWTKSGTDGYQSIAAGQEKIPLSLGGVYFPDEGMSSWLYRTKGVLTFSKETSNMLKIGPKFCKSTKIKPLTKAEHRFLIKQNFFARSVLFAYSQLVPKWLAIDVQRGYTGFHVNNIQSMVLKSSRMKELPLCFNFPQNFPAGIYATQVVFTPIVLQALSKTFHSESAYPTCLAINACNQHVYYSLPEDKSVDFTPDLRMMNIASLKLLVHGFGFSGSSSFTKKCWRTLEANLKNSSEDCFEPKIFLKVSGALVVGSANLKLNGEAFVSPSSLASVAVKRFSVANKYSFKGNVMGSLAMKIGGKSLKFDIQDGSAVGYGILGGAQSKPEVDSLSGFHFKTNSRVFSSQGSLVTFHPNHRKSASEFYFRVLSSIQGGDVYAAQNAAKIRLMMRLLSKSLPSSASGLMMSLRRRRSLYSAEYAALESFKNHAAGRLQRIKDTVSKPNVDYQTVQSALSQLLALTETISDVTALLETRVQVLERSFSVKRSILMRVRFLKRTIKSANDLSPVPKARPSSESYSGLNLGYSGRLCFQALCFDNLKVAVYDLTSPNSLGLKDADSILVSGTFTGNQSIAGIFNVTHGTTLRAEVSRSRKVFTVELPVRTRIFGKHVLTKLKITPTTASFALPEFEFDIGFGFNLMVSAKNSEKTTWQTLFFSINGVLPEGSKASRKVESLVKRYIKKASILFRNRRSQSFEKLQSSVKNSKSKKKALKPKKLALDKAERQFRKLQGDYGRSLATLRRARIAFRSYRVSEIFQNIEKKFNRSCTINHCGEVCVPVPICGICQERIMVDANTLNCDTISKKAITTVEQPLESDCQLTDYRFKTIYTGTCKKGKEAQLNAALTGIGAGTGALIGTAIAGPIGAAIGGAIGTVVGFIGGLFSSCDETYEVYKEVINRQVGCTLRTFKPKTVLWKEAECYAKTKTVLSSYSDPEKCRCNNNTCVSIQSPACLVNNSKCIDERKGILRGSLEAAGSRTNDYEKLEDAQEAVQTTFLQMLQGEKKLLFAKRDYEKASALLRQEELEVKLKKSSLQNYDKNFALERCLSSLQPRLKIRKIEFESNTAAQENILFRLDVQDEKSRRVFKKTFLYDIKDSDVSLQRGARRLAREVYCAGKYRRRRALSKGKVEENVEGLLIQNTTVIPTDASDAKRACLVSKIIFSFFKQNINALIRVLRDAKISKQDADKAINTIDESLVQGAGSEVGYQNRMLDSLKRQLTKDSGGISARSIRNDWLNSMEIGTGVRNFTRCFNFEDCLSEAGRQLRSLPSLISIGRRGFNELIRRHYNHNFAAVNARSISALQTAANDITSTLESILQASLFCAEKPAVTLTPSKKVAVFVGSSLRLKCEASSQLPVEYSWSHDGVPLLSQDSDVLRLNVDSSKQGRYRCMVSSLAGKTTSHETFVEVRQAPRFVNEPQDFQYYFTLPKEIIPHFVCNATADPPPVISWYFQRYGSGQVVQFAHSKPVLSLGNPTVADSGHYFCKAENAFGKITSRKARLDVLKSRLPNQAFRVSFNVKVGRSGAPNKASYAQHLKREGRLTASQDLDVVYEYQSGRDLNIDIRVTDNLEKNMTQESSSGISNLQMLRVVSRSRQHLSGVVERIVDGLTRKRGRSANNAMKESMNLGFSGDLCQRGYFLHENGFTCAECPVGKYEHNGKCINCSIGTYQSEPGQTACMKCDVNQVTKDVSSVNKYQCITPDLKSTDIIFVLDTSSSIGMRNWRKVKNFVGKFAQNFIRRDNDLRVGVITFGTVARLRIPLRKYSSWQLRNRMQYLSYYGGASRTSRGLILAGKELNTGYKPGRKQILFVMTDGQSTTIRGVPGFILARRAALHLLAKGIHIVAVGVGDKVDPSELRAIASYPKQEHVVRYGSFRSLVSASKRISAMALRGSCFSEMKDIAILIEGSSLVRSNLWRKVKGFASELLAKLAVTAENKVSLSTFSANIRKQQAFKSVGSKKEIKKIVRQMAKDSRQADYKKVLEYAFNQLLHEKVGSLSPTKIVVLLTKAAFDRSLLGKIRRDYPEERLRVFTVSMSLSREDGFGQFSNAFEEQAHFSITQLSRLVKAIQATNFSSEICQAGRAKE